MHKVYTLKEHIQKEGANENEVKYFYADGNNQLVKGTNYSPGTLYKTTSYDEDNKSVTEYKDKLGQVVMKRNSGDVDTYYVYNDLGQLCYVIPPKAVDELIDLNEDNPIMKQYCYMYKYDERGNCKYKKLPGCEPIYMAYDRANRLVESQDGNQRLQNKWTVTKYDLFGRVISTGTITDAATTWPVLNSNNYQHKNNLIVETYANGVYSNTYFSDALPLIVNYYDDYNFLPTSSPLLYQEKQGYSIRYSPPSGGRGAAGLLTGTRTYLLDGSGAYTASAMYYDDKGRVVQTRSTNHLGGYDIVYNDLDFTGKPNKTLKEHNIAGQAVIPELYTYSYDHAGRVTKTEYQLNGQPTETLADMTASGSYDELGRLKIKKRHNTDTEQFDYNIRNWITKITSGEFEENLYYNTKPSNIDQATPFYNGNICYNTWTYNGSTRGYQYNYDGLNRYTGGYAFINNVLQVDYQYSESFNYDKMGNITSLTRFSAEDISDQLYLCYNGNQLKYVNDNGIQQSIYGLKDYQNKSNTQDEFAYDANGNMTKDLDRDIYTIRYNLLNLPDTIQFKNGHQIINKYDASGKKLSTRYYTVLVTAQVPLVSTLTPGKTIKLQYDMDIIDETGTFYVDNFEYGFNGCDPGWYWVERIYNPEGYFKDRGDFGDMGFNYFRRDHLGNNREVWHPQYSFNNISYTEKTIQRTQYYPSGLPWAESTGAIVQNKKYNGKEWIEMHGLDEYDSQARMYYPAIMHTTTLDPLAEKYYNISPYAWCGNNPVNYIDPFGMDMDWVEDKNHHVYWDDNAKSQETTKKGERYLDKTVFATDKEGNVFYGDEAGRWHDFASIPEVTVIGDKDYNFHKSFAYQLVGELANGRLDDRGYGPWNPDAISLEVGASGNLKVFSGSVSTSFIFSNSEAALSVNTTRNAGLNNSSGLRTPSVSLFAGVNAYKSLTNQPMSLMPYRGTGVVSNLTTGNIGFNYGTGPNGQGYHSYGINVNTTSGAGFSQGITNSYYIFYITPNDFYFFNHKLW